MKTILSLMGIMAVVATALCSNVSQASEGRVIQCMSASKSGLDNDKVYARFFPDGIRPYETTTTVIVYKDNSNLPSYWLDNCLQSPGKGILLQCSGAGNRTVILHDDNTATYIGSHETTQLTCGSEYAD